MTLADWLLIVDANVEGAVEDAWNEWYDEEHLPEIVGCPGFIRAARYVSAEPSQSQPRYVTVYELESKDAVASAEFNSRRGWGRFAGSVDARVTVFRRIASEDGDDHRV